MLKARMTAEQIQLREGLEATLVANEIARAVALGEGLRLLARKRSRRLSGSAGPIALPSRYRRGQP